MGDMSGLVLLGGGLDLVTPVQATEAGSLTDTLNYEIGPVKGYKRIDGYERYDGFAGGGVSNRYRTSFGLQPLSTVLVVGTQIYMNATGELVGIVTQIGASPASPCFYVPTSPGRTVRAGDIVVLRNPATGVESLAPVTSTAEDSRTIGLSPEEYVEGVIEAGNALRSAVITAPRAIAGVYHSHKSTYVVIDCIAWGMNGASALPDVGAFLRYGGTVYTVMGYRGSVVHLADMSITQTLSNDVYIVDSDDIVGDSGGVGPITGIDMTQPDGTAWYAVPHRAPSARAGSLVSAPRQYRQAIPTAVLSFTDGASQPYDTIRIDTPTGDLIANVISYVITSGSFSNGDATGYIYYHWGHNVAGGGFNGEVPSGTDVYTNSPGGEVLLGEVETNTLPLWAGTLALRDLSVKDHETRYQWGTYNFLGTAGEEYAYAANGVTRGGWIKETDYTSAPLYGNIITNPQVIQDTPKYVSMHAGQRLVFGHHSGSAVLSAVGQPFDFSGANGAIELGTGDNITGMLEGVGNSTLVFGPRSIHRVSGRGTNIEMDTLSAEAGAFDYSCVNVGTVPVYTNQNGICSLESTSAYGDFSNSSISSAIDTMLRPAVVQDTSSFELGGVVCAFAVRSKNQYRLFLGDGTMISLAVTNDGPQPMVSNYQPEEYAIRLPFAWSSSVDDWGEEYLLVVWDRVRASKGDRGVIVNLPPDNVVYRLDHGWGFDGVSFSHYIDMAYMFNERPNFLTIDGATLYGLGYGKASLRLRSSGIETDFNQPYDVTIQELSLPYNPEVLYTRYKHVTNKIDHANWGRAIKLRIENLLPAGSNEGMEPAHILQSMRLSIQTEGAPE